MKYSIRYLPLADLDLIEIDANVNQFPVKASKFFASIDRQLSLLTRNPLMYPVYDDIQLYRKMIVLDYLVFYIVNETNGTIDIHRIINGRMDVNRQL